MLKHLKSRWFLIALAVTLVVGYLFADALQPVVQAPGLRQCIVAIVMFLMALPLGLGAMAATLRNPMPALLAVVMNSVAVPLACWGASAGMGLMSTDMANGLLIAGATPCTLASASVWTRRAGGNDAVALLVTIITNLFCFLTTPFWLYDSTGEQHSAHPGNSFSAMAMKLAILVVVPMVLAQFLRMNQSIAKWSTKQKTPLGIAAQIGLLMMVLFGAAQAGQKLNSNLGALVGLDIAVMVSILLAIHVGILFTGMRVAKRLRLKREDQIAVGIAGSQKTLMVGLHIAATYFPNSLAMLPMIVYHAGQLLADTAIADRLRQGNPAEKSTVDPLS